MKERDTYTSDGGGYPTRKRQRNTGAWVNAMLGATGSRLMEEAREEINPTYRTERSLASRPQSNQLYGRGYERPRYHAEQLVKTSTRSSSPKAQLSNNNGSSVGHQASKRLKNQTISSYARAYGKAKK